MLRHEPDVFFIFTLEEVIMRHLVVFSMLLLMILAFQEGAESLELTGGMEPAQISMETPEASPTFWFDPSMNFGQASGWVLGSGILTIEVDDPATPIVPDYIGTNTADPDPDANNFNIEDFEVQGGYVITILGPLASDPSQIISKTLIVHEMLVGASFDDEIVYGYAGWGDEVCIEVEQPSGWCSNWQCVGVDPFGYWEVDFSTITCESELPGPIDLEPGLFVVPHQWDDDGDGTDLHWSSTSAMSVRCVGFEGPLKSYPVIVRGNRVLPLKAKLFDAWGTELTDLQLATPPLVQVSFNAGDGKSINITQSAKPVGHDHDGNQFSYSGSYWRLNLHTGKYSSPGIYTITMKSGDPSEYRIYSYSTCKTQFIRQ